MRELDRNENKLTREILVEKYILPSYVDHNGYSFWLDRYGEAIRSEDPFGNSVPILRRTTSYLDAGFIYAPYIPVYCTPIFKSPGVYTTEHDESIVGEIYGHPNEFNPSEKLLSRFAKKEVNNTFYGLVTVSSDLVA